MEDDPWAIEMPGKLKKFLISRAVAANVVEKCHGIGELQVLLPAIGFPDPRPYHLVV